MALWFRVIRIIYITYYWLSYIMAETNIILPFDRLVYTRLVSNRFNSNIDKLFNLCIWAKILKMIESNTMNHMLFMSIISDSYISQSISMCLCVSYFIVHKSINIIVYKIKLVHFLIYSICFLYWFNIAIYL